MCPELRVAAVEIEPVHVPNVDVDPGRLRSEDLRPDVEVFTGDGEAAFVTQGDVLFDTDSATVRPEAQDTLAAVAEQIAATAPAGSLIRVEGHTDDRADDAHNLDLSRRRAQAVADWLVASGGFDPARLVVVGLGESSPAYPNDSDENRAKNRRVVITIDGRLTSAANRAAFASLADLGGRRPGFRVARRPDAEVLADLGDRSTRAARHGRATDGRLHDRSVPVGTTPDGLQPDPPRTTWSAPWYRRGMRGTIDKAGRVVVPKQLRDRAGLVPGEVEIIEDGTGIRIEPVAAVELVEHDGHLLIARSSLAIGDDEIDELRRVDQR